MLLLYGSFKSINASIGLRIYRIVGILWDPSRISWDPTPRGIYTASCMGMCVGSQQDPKGSHKIPLPMLLLYGSFKSIGAGIGLKIYFRDPVGSQ